MPSATGSSPGRPGSSHRVSGPVPSAVTRCCASTLPSSPTKWCWTSSAASIAAPCQPHGRPGRRPMTYASRSASDRMSSQGTRPAFGRIAIVNRGEPAMRLINAVREWNAEGRRALRVIALYTAADQRAMFVREADEAVLIGPADPVADGTFGASPYLDYGELERVLRECRADAVWPGWGFVSEKAEFAELCDRLGITFIGPPAEVMRRLGDKNESRQLAGQVGVPLAAWSGEAVAGLEQATGGGRHIEVQVVADADGAVWTLGVRDCSVQRRNQKVIEESSSTVLDAEQEHMLRSSAAGLIRAAGYVNAGTVDFLYEPKERLLSFLGVSPQLQAGHPVTEVTTGVDIVKLQLHIASGGTLADISSTAPDGHGHAIEARLSAEDPEHGFAPAPGLIEHLVVPTGPGTRVDTGVAAGDVIPPQSDSMIAKVIAWGRDRREARDRLVRALRQTVVVIHGGTTNKAFLLDLLDRPEFVCGEVDTTWLDALMADGYTPPRRLDVALLATAVEAYDAHAQRQEGRLFASAERGRPELGHETWHQFDVRADGAAYRLRVSRCRPVRYRVELDGHAVDADVERYGRFERRLTVGDQAFAVLSA